LGRIDKDSLPFSVEGRSISTYEEVNGMIHYRCTKCGQTLTNPVSSAGQQDKCPTCGQDHIVPREQSRKLFIGIIIGACGAVTLLIVLVIFLIYGSKPTALETALVGHWRCLRTGDDFYFSKTGRYSMFRQSGGMHPGKYRVVAQDETKNTLKVKVEHMESGWPAMTLDLKFEDWYGGKGLSVSMVIERQELPPGVTVPLLPPGEFFWKRVDDDENWTFKPDKGAPE
jgi:predicted RNA-binding Zn-ribbon protein involved in translation (DUF1610 family)